ncbi:MAG TPA: DMT family transporter [Steroidobacteraceae bacterium]|nr:DMT family transporter [Steroidobacteraceae bacterium]
MPSPVNRPTNERLRGIASMIAAVFVFAIMDASLKRLSTQYGMFQVACMRSLSSLFFISLPIVWQRSWQTLRMRSPRLHVFRAILGVTMLASFITAVRSLSLAETYSVFLCAPLLMTALSVPMQGERVPAKRWIAIGIGLGGVLLILRPSGSSSGSTAALLAAAVGTLCYALSALTVRMLGKTQSNASMVFWYLTLVGTLSAVFALRDWQPIPAGDWPWLMLVGLSGALGQSWITDAFRRAPPSVVGPFEYTSMLWAFAIDWIFWSAQPTAALLAGAGVVIASGIFVIVDERRMAQLAMNPGSPPP